MQVSPSQLVTLLERAIPARLPVLITGAPGVGKSDIVGQAAELTGAELILSHPAVADPTDFKGLPWPNKEAGSADFLPFGEFSRALNAKTATVWFMDDLGQAPPSVQAACFPPKTPVMTVNGAVDIDALQVGDLVIDGNGAQQRITETFTRQADGLVEIKAVGLLPVRATVEHPIYVSKGRKKRYVRGEDGKYTVASIKHSTPEWISAGNVKTGDWVAMPIPQPNRSDSALIFQDKGHTRREMTLTPDFAKLCGYYCGDGWYEQHDAVQAIGFALDDKYPEIQSELTELIERVLDTRIYSRQRKNHKRIGFHDPALGQFLAATIGDRSENKRIPDFILYHENIGLLTAFLQGYLATDGARLASSGVIRGIQWGGVSRTLNLQLQIALARYGTLAAIKFHCKEGQTMISPSTGKSHSVQNAYVIQTSDKRVLNALGEPYDAKRDVCWSYVHDGKIWTRVKSVTPVAYSGPVFNIEVENSHTYTANNMVVHNCMQLILARRVNGHILPDCVTFVAATNRRADRAGVSGILEPVKSRFATIIELHPDIDSWCNWAIGAGIPATLIAFLRFRPDLLSDFKPSADMSNSPMPRTWASLAKLEALSLPQQVELAAMAGAVGEGPAAEYIAFRRMYQSLTSVDAILLDPQGCKLPTAPNELYATCTALASKVTEQNLSRIGIYANRLMDAGRGEFAVLLMRDVIRRNPKLQYSDAYIRIACGPIGQLISGQAN
jgi:hypothetical protein